MAGTIIADFINGDNIAGGFLGVNQTWQDVTASRSAGVTYTNTTGKPIMVAVSVNWSGNNGVEDKLEVNGVKVAVVGTDNSSTTNAISVLSAAVPNGHTYKLTVLRNIKNWAELR